MDRSAPPALLMLIDGSTDTLIVRVPRDTDRAALKALIAPLGDTLIGWAFEDEVEAPHAIMSFATYATETTAPGDLALMHADRCHGAGRRPSGPCSCGLLAAAVRLRELAGVRPRLTEPQERLLIELFDNAGVAPVDGRREVAVRSLESMGLAERHGAAAVKLTPLGVAEAARRAGTTVASAANAL